MLKAYLILSIFQNYFYRILYNNVCPIQNILLLSMVKFFMIFHYANILLDKNIKIRTVKMINCFLFI
jgi:hypothetical protein